MFENVPWRTSRNAVKRKSNFAEYSFHALR
jgi:hypothetical protein